MTTADNVATTQPARGRYARMLAGYGVTLTLTVAIFFAIRHYGEQLVPRGVASPPSVAESSAVPHSLFHVLISLLTIIVLGRVLGRLAVYMGQPRVIGEMVAGIAVGPSILGRISPEAMQFVLPAEIDPLLGIIAQIGIILYMFVVGLELNGELFHSQAHATIGISTAGIVAPFIMGAGLALWMFPALAPRGVSFTSFALFVGVAMSITAFPVLARILGDRKVDQTPLGVMALSCAAIGDVTAWCLLALVVGVVQTAVSGAVYTAVCALAYTMAMVFVVRPFANRYLHPHSSAGRSPSLPAWLLIGLLLSAVTTEWIGIHAIFGAFLFGAIIPHDCPAAVHVQRDLDNIVKVLLLPTFFAYSGMRTQIGLLTTTDDWIVCGAIVLVATAGKFGGTLVAARLMGLNWNTSLSLGVLMNTRGLMELVVLNVGLELGVISPRSFAMMVIMALITTVATSPILTFLERYGHPDDEHKGSACAKRT